MDVRKAYGLVAAVGTRLGEQARDDDALIPRVRATADADAFRALVRERVAGALPDAVVASFLDDVVTPEDWRQWKSRLLIQMRMTKEGGKPAPGHEKGKGVGRP